MTRGGSWLSRPRHAEECAREVRAGASTMFALAVRTGEVRSLTVSKKGNKDEWVIEATATMAERSDGVTRRSDRTLRTVEVSLTEVGDAVPGPALLEYEAQDFWVTLFNGQGRQLPLGD